MVAYNGIMVISTLVVQKLRGWREVTDTHTRWLSQPYFVVCLRKESIPKTTCDCKAYYYSFHFIVLRHVYMLSFCKTYSPLFCALYTHVHFLVQAIRNGRVMYAEIVVLFCRVCLFLCYLFVVKYILIYLLIKELCWIFWCTCTSFM